MWFFVFLFFGWIVWFFYKSHKEEKEKKISDDYKKSQGIDISPIYYWTSQDIWYQDAITGKFEGVEESIYSKYYIFRLTYPYDTYHTKSSGEKIKRTWVIGDRVAILARDDVEEEMQPTNLTELVSKVKIGMEVCVSYIGRGFGYRRKDGSFGDLVTSMKSSLLLLSKNTPGKVDVDYFVKAAMSDIKNDCANPNSKHDLAKYYNLFEISKHNKANNKWIKVGRSFKKYVLMKKTDDWGLSLLTILNRRIENTPEWRQYRGIQKDLR